MNVGTLCHRSIATIEAHQSLQQAALTMRERHVGMLVVVAPGPEGRGLQVSGVITDRDLAIEVLARGGDVPEVPAGRLATSPVVSIGEDALVEQAITLMQTQGVRRVLVHDADGLLVGVLSMDDLLPACIAPLAGLAEAVRRGMERELARRGAIAAPAQGGLRIPAVGTAGWVMA